VNLAAVVENARTVARVAGTRLLPVVKANAYGVGAVAVSKALETVDPWGYGVATVDEGVELRAAGIARPVLVFMPARPDRFDAYEAHRLTPALGDRASIHAWIARGARGGAFHLEIDTGITRPTGATARPTHSSSDSRPPWDVWRVGRRSCTWRTARRRFGIRRSRWT